MTAGITADVRAGVGDATTNRAVAETATSLGSKTNDWQSVFW